MPAPGLPAEVVFSATGGGNTTLGASSLTEITFASFPPLALSNVPSLISTLTLNSLSISAAPLFRDSVGAFLGAASGVTETFGTFAAGLGSAQPATTPAQWAAGGSVTLFLLNSTGAPITFDWAVVAAILDTDLPGPGPLTSTTTTAATFGSVPTNIATHKLELNFSGRLSDPYYHLATSHMGNGASGGGYSDVPTWEVVQNDDFPYFYNIGTRKQGDVQAGLAWYKPDAPGNFDNPLNPTSGVTYEVHGVPNVDTLLKARRLATDIAIVVTGARRHRAAVFG